MTVAKAESLGGTSSLKHFRRTFRIASYSKGKRPNLYLDYSRAAIDKFARSLQYDSIVPISKSMNSRRGFASMAPVKRSRIASLGGKAAHAQGKAHRFTHSDAVRAG